MSHIPITLLAYLLNAAAVTVDKLMLSKHIPHPLTYIFYISLASALSLVLLPLTHIPQNDVLFGASLSTILWTSGAYLMFHALKIGVASRVIPIIGTLIPLILLIFSIGDGSVNDHQALSILILVVGMVVLTAPDWRGRLAKNELLLEIGSAFLFAISYLVLHQVYLKDDFLTVLIWSRLILLPLAVILIITPHTRKLIFGLSTPKQINLLPEHKKSLNFFSPHGILFIFGQLCGGLSELLLTYSISLATPALVNSLQGTQYIFLLFFSWMLAKKYPTIFSDHSSKLTTAARITGIIIISLGLFNLAFS